MASHFSNNLSSIDGGNDQPAPPPENMASHFDGYENLQLFCCYFTGIYNLSFNFFFVFGDEFIIFNIYVLIFLFPELLNGNNPFEFGGNIPSNFNSIPHQINFPATNPPEPSEYCNGIFHLSHSKIMFLSLL